MPEEEHKKHIKDGTFPTQPVIYHPANPEEVVTHKTIISEHKFELKNAAMVSKAPGQHMAHTPQQIDEHMLLGESALVVHSENRDKRYCICGKQNDNNQYVLCEDECEWYHPECVGFDLLMFESNSKIKFICPMCKASTKQKLMDGERRSAYSKLESQTKRNFYVFIPMRLPVG